MDLFRWYLESINTNSLEWQPREGLLRTQNPGDGKWETLHYSPHPCKIKTIHKKLNKKETTIVSGHDGNKNVWKAKSFLN